MTSGERYPVIFRQVLILVVAALAFAAAAHAKPVDLVAQALPTIDKVDADWLPAMKAGDADRLAEPYARDAVFVTPDGKAIVGHDSIADLYRAGAASGRKVIDGGIHRLGAREGGGGMVYEWGTGGSTRIGPDGARTTHEGQYLTVWKRDEAGAWRIIRNMAF